LHDILIQLVPSITLSFIHYCIAVINTGRLLGVDAHTVHGKSREDSSLLKALFNVFCFLSYTVRIRNFSLYLFTTLMRCWGSVVTKRVIHFQFFVVTKQLTMIKIGTVRHF